MSEDHPSTSNEEFIGDGPPRKILKTATGVSSILDLKNELLKKKAEANAAKGKGVILGKKGVLYVRKNEKEQQRTEAAERRKRIDEHAEALRREEEERILLVNRRLKEKAELYDKLAEGGIHVEGDTEPLVDFVSKKRDRVEEREEEEEDADNVHFVAGEEQRVYGASHVIFSRNEEKRQTEMAALLKMTEETDKTRAKQKSIQQIRAEAQKAKAKALRARLGLPDLDEEEKKGEPEPTVFLDIPLPPEEDEQKKEEKKKEPAKMREWDRGKGSVQNWVRSRREERDDDFAPPSRY